MNGARGESTPNPDPTILTREALRDAMENQDKLLESKLETLRKVGDTRHKEIDEQLKVRLIQFTSLVDSHKTEDALQHAAESALRSTGEARLGEQIKFHETRLNGILEQVVLKGVVEEKFAGVDKQFAERDVRSERETTASQLAVNAAFAAQKESATKQDESNQKAIDKSENRMDEKVDKMAELSQTEIRSLTAQIIDLKGRVIQVEGSLSSAAIALGAATSNTDRRTGQSNWGITLAFAVGLGVINLVVVLVNMLIGKH